jgi:hypothetical protein
MSKKSTIPALAAITAITSTKNEISDRKSLPGSEAVQKSIVKKSTRKKRMLGVNLSQNELDVTKKLALKLQKLGLQYSESNAVRVAIRLFDANDTQIAKIAAEIRAEDGRRHR